LENVFFRLALTLGYVRQDRAASCLGFHCSICCSGLRTTLFISRISCRLTAKNHRATDSPRRVFDEFSGLCLVCGTRRPTEKAQEKSKRMALEDSGESASRKELLANIRRLTIAVLDDLEQGSRDKTLDQGQKRLLSSTGSRLLRLWRNTLKDDAIDGGAGRARDKALVSEKLDPDMVSLN
jgi:hypothetical protein